ncbi:MAG: cytochrome D1 domain-containing protein [Gemmobacter sp.]
MKRARPFETALAALAGLWLLALPAVAEPELDELEVASIYYGHCAVCHGGDRFGGIGPALLPENLGRLTLENAVAVIAEGRNATQMPGFSHELTDTEIAALADYVMTPLPSVPTWEEHDIIASQITHAEVRQIDGPLHGSDPMNLFVVVETGDHHATILDGDTFEPLTRFQTQFALHGGPKFTPDGRFVFFMSRDGWVSKYDLWTLELLAETRAGINARNIALSADGRFVAVANYLPHTLVILSADDLSVQKIFDVRDSAGVSSRVSAVYQAQPRHSFVAALKDVPEIWEVATDPALLAAQGGFELRRIEAPEPLDDFFFDPPYDHLIGSARDSKAIVVDLNAGREIRRLDVPGLPHLGSGIAWEWGGHAVMATPHLRAGKISVIDMDDWEVLRLIETPGPGFFMRSHENTPFAWTDGMLGPQKDTMAIIDKRTLEVVRTLTPEPGRVAAHVEFDRHGRHALVSVWEIEGALVVYDAETFTEVKRIPMSRPSGKYNVWNKITFSDGTSH